MIQTYLTRSQLVEIYPVPKSRPGLRNCIKRLGFPKPTYANPNCPLWKPEEASEWFENRPKTHASSLADNQIGRAK
jgi:hypothetical protein